MCGYINFYLVRTQHQGRISKYFIKEKNIPIRKKKIFLLEKEKYSNYEMENIPIRKRKIFWLEKGKYSNQKKENIPMRKRKIFQLQRGKYSN